MMRKESSMRDWMSRRALVTGALAGTAASAMPSAAQAPAGATTPFTAPAVEGPFYLEPGVLRADIAEGRAGVPLDVVFAIRDETGAVIPGARVDIWHCDAKGLYSGFPGQGEEGRIDARGETFLRGAQMAGADGSASFSTIYPGWYPGRTTHIHFKIIDGGRTILTSQLFLPDALSEFLYANVGDYARARPRDTFNSTDGIALRAGETARGSVRETAGRYLAFLEVKVDRKGGRAAEGFWGFLGGPPPGGAPPPRSTLDGARRIEALIPRKG
jgi:protocatechuate 3,4-dioxygenase beta subunit